MLLFSNIFDSLSNMDYDPELFGKALPCLIAIGCALPPDYSLSKNTDEDYYGRQMGAPDQPQYVPNPIDTNNVHLDNDLNSLVQKFSEHYHDAWASRRLEGGWTYGEIRSDIERKHPRLKPYNMLSEYVRSIHTSISISSTSNVLMGILLIANRLHMSILIYISLFISNIYLYILTGA